MKIVTGEVMQQIDRRAIEEYGVSGLDLMENAGRGCAEAIVTEFGSGPEHRAVVIAGKGNNGGDGYVIARHLQNSGWRVATFVLSARDEITGDARVNLDLLAESSLVFCPEQGGLGHYQTVFRETHIIVDALLGTGLGKEVQGIYADAVSLINSAGKPIVAVDIASGIDSGNGRVLGCAVRADTTVTFALPKLGHLLYPGIDHAGRLRVVDIGIPPELLEGPEIYEFVDAEAVRSIIRKRDRSAHKGNFGHSLIVAGSTGKTGAAAMAANSAVRAGSGLVTLAIPASLNHILEMKTTEAMTLPLPDDEKGCLAGNAKAAIDTAVAGKDALALGPGMSCSPETARLIRALAGETLLPMVIDADGLNALSEDVAVLVRKRSSAVILTPHPGEMARLAGMTVDAVETDRVGTARKFAAAYQVFLVLKGARTVIAAPDGRIAVNGSGNPGMATGGMGDVLTGTLVALLAQGYDTFTACRLGVFLHGFAADLVAAEMGEIGMSAVDVQERLPYAFRELMA
jgi:ADP-dependent NAD(P)H-hydrate dehydratase / NAD(P)H-hydrate epimerase